MGVSCERARRKAKQRDKREQHQQNKQKKQQQQQQHQYHQTGDTLRISANSILSKDGNNGNYVTDNDNTIGTYNNIYRCPLKPVPHFHNISNVVISRLSQLISFNLSHKSTRTSTATNSHCAVRHSLCLYAASSVILALCYLTTLAAASDTNHTIFE